MPALKWRLASLENSRRANLEALHLSDFWQALGKLPTHVQQLAHKNFALLKANPRHPSLQLKRIDDLWAARVGIHHRTLGIDTIGGIQWIWIGSHAEYDRLIG